MDQVKGRKRHLHIDTLGLGMAVVVTAASCSDPVRARLLLRRVGGACKKMRVIWVDGAYRGQLVEWVLAHFWFRFKSVLRSDSLRGFFSSRVGGSPNVRGHDSTRIGA